MDRRSFLRALGISAGAAVLSTLDIPIIGAMAEDPERLLWVPGQRTYFLPSQHYSYVTVETITREAIRLLEQNLAFSKRINRAYADSYVISTGTPVRLRQPRCYVTGRM